MKKILYPEKKSIIKKIIFKGILFSIFIHIIFVIILTILVGDLVFDVSRIVANNSYEIIFGSENMHLNDMHLAFVDIVIVIIISIISFSVLIFIQSYYWYKKNKIKVIISDKGIFSQYGKFKKQTNWKDFKELKKTFLPILIKYSKKTYISDFLDIIEIDEAISKKTNKI